MELTDLIEDNPDGAVFAGTSVPIRSLFEFVRDDQTLETFLHNFPSISRYHALTVLSASLNMLEGEPPQSNSDQTQALPTEGPTTEALATAAPNLVCKWCKDPIYAVSPDEYVHAYTGSPQCVCRGNWPICKSWHPHATPYDDKETYTRYRGRLIGDLTKNLVSYLGASPHEMLEMILADARHFADTHRLNFDDHNRRSFQLYLDNIRGSRR
jgi:hypothetical protein